MRLDELDLKARTWLLPGARTKNGRSHLVPLPALALSIIEEALADAQAEQGKRHHDPKAESAFVFPSGKGALAPMAVARTIGRAQYKSEQRPLGRFRIPHWTAHDLRRTALTGMARLGIPPIVAGAVANHLSVTRATITLSVYTHYTYEREKRDALDLWAERLRAIVSGQGADVTPLRRAGQ